MLRRFLIPALLAGLFSAGGITAWAGETGLYGEQREIGITLVAEQSDGFGNFILERRLSGGIMAPDTMWSAFDKNKSLADARFRGKRIDVRGRIKSFAIENGNLPTMYFAAGPNKKHYVICTFEGEPEDVFEGLAVGQPVTLVGTCAGRVRNDILFKHCKIKSRK